MFTDTVGFTTAGQANESETLELLREPSDLARTIVENHAGRWVRSTGDAWQWLQLDPRLASARKDPGYRTLLRRVHLA